MQRTTNRTIGRRGEDLAVSWLSGLGYRVVDRNWYCRRGEVDVVAWDDDTLVFVEVKTRTGIGAGHPLEAVTDRKVARMRRVAAEWCVAHPDVRATHLRVDAVGIQLDPTHDEWAVDHARDLS